MAEGKSVSIFAALLRDLVAWLDATAVPGVVIGGVAASLLGRPRLTRDVDALVLLDEEHWEQFVFAGQAFGFEPRAPDALAFARQNRVLLLRHGPSGIDLDLSFGALPFEEEAVSRAKRIRVSGVSFPLISPEDLLIMKAVAHRPRDLADIEGVLDKQSDLDLDRVWRWLREFSAALEIPEILDDVRRMARNRRIT